MYVCVLSLFSVLCLLVREKRNAYSVLVGKLRGKKSPVKPSVDGRMILKGMLNEEDERVLNGFVWLRIGMCGRLL